MARVSYSESKFSRLISVTGRDEDFFLIRRGEKNSRVVSVDKKSTAGEVVKTDLLHNERPFEVEVPAAPVNGEAVATVASTEEEPTEENTAPLSSEDQMLKEEFHSDRAEVDADVNTDVDSLLAESRAVLVNPTDVEEMATA